MLRVLTFLLVLAAAIYALGLYLRRTGMFFPDRFPAGRWDTTAWMVTPVEQWFTTSDGVRLHAWRFDSASPAAPVMIWFHGNAGNLTDRAEMAAGFAKRGVTVLLFDWRGYGKSEGKPTERALRRDAVAAFDHVTATLPGRSVVLYGESIGGPYAAWVAKERKGVACVVLENSFPSLRALGNAIFAPLPLGLAAPLALPTTAWLNETRAPVLVMHGTRDAVIPYRLGVELYEGLRGPKELLTSHAGHCEIPIFEADRYYATVTRFIAQHTGGR